MYMLSLEYIPEPDRYGNYPTREEGEQNSVLTRLAKVEDNLHALENVIAATRSETHKETALLNPNYVRLVTWTKRRNDSYVGAPAAVPTIAPFLFRYEPPPVAFTAWPCYRIEGSVVTHHNGFVVNLLHEAINDYVQFRYDRTVTNWDITASVQTALIGGQRQVGLYYHGWLFGQGGRQIYTADVNILQGIFGAHNLVDVRNPSDPAMLRLHASEYLPHDYLAETKVYTHLQAGVWAFSPYNAQILTEDPKKISFMISVAIAPHRGRTRAHVALIFAIPGGLFQGIPTLWQVMNHANDVDGWDPQTSPGLEPFLDAILVAERVGNIQ